MSDLDVGFDEEFSEEGVEVIAPSGAVFVVLTHSEVTYFEGVAAQYLKHNHFTNITDLQDLDRVIFMETMCYRWGLWQSKERDYFGQNIDAERTQRAVTEYSKEIRLIKKSLGLDKSARDKDKGESIAEYIDNLRIRAREFGVMRNTQAATAITLFKELQSLVVFHDNCSDQERREQRDLIVNPDEIMDWLRTVAFPEMDAIDIEFRKNQSTWVRDM